MTPDSSSRGAYADRVPPRMATTLRTPSRGLRTRPGTFLLGPTGARLWADYLDPVVGFAGRLDFIHKLNIPELFRTEAPGAEHARWETTWTPSHLEARVETARWTCTETKFITWDDCAVSLQTWHNTGPDALELRLRGPVWTAGDDTSWSRTQRAVLAPHDIPLAMTLGATPDHPPTAAPGVHRLAPGAHLDLVVAAALDLDDDGGAARRAARLKRLLDPAVSPSALLEQHVADYYSWFDGTPELSSSDPVLDRAWDYRWFLLRHTYADPRFGRLDRPLFYEGRSHKMAKEPWAPQGWEFSKLIPLSSPMHLLESRWHPDATLGNDLLATLEQAQSPTGELIARTASTDLHGYANFLGWAAWQYALVHREEFGVTQALPTLKRQVRGELEHRTPAGDVLPVETDHRLTGKEYQPSFWFFHDFPADPFDRATYTPLKRVDRAVYQYRNARGVAALCDLVGDPDAAEFTALADRLADAIRRRMWEPGEEFFVDLHHATDQPALVRNVVGFYPYWAGITDAGHDAGFDRALGPDDFGTAHPFPSVSPQCPVYSAQGGWQGWFVKGRNGCMWNGPTWPYTNSVVVDAIGSMSRSRNHRDDDRFAEALRAHVALHFGQLDGRTPYLVEHYDSATGEPISDEVDYHHSYLIDLVVRYVAGLEVGVDEVVVDPLDIGLDHFALTGVPVRGHLIDVTYRRDASVDVPYDVGLQARVDGVIAFSSPSAQPGRVPLPS